MFKRNSDSNITQIAKLQASDASANGAFGWSVSMDGDYIVVGVYNNSESAYVFKRNSETSITQIAKLSSSDSQAQDYFGFSVSISGDYIVVGAYNQDTGAQNAGAAYVFKRNSDSANDTTQIAKIQASDKQANDYFGRSVSISGDLIVVGADYEDVGATDTGSAYVFKRNSDTTNDVTQLDKLVAKDAEDSDRFGTAVSIDNGYIVVGANSEDSAASDAGALYIYYPEGN